MSAVWVVRDTEIVTRIRCYAGRDEIPALFLTSGRYTVTRETLLTPEMAAVIEAAKGLADLIGLPLRADCAVTIRFHNGVQEPNALTELISAVATLREQEGA